MPTECTAANPLQRELADSIIRLSPLVNEKINTTNLNYKYSAVYSGWATGRSEDTHSLWR